MTEAFIHLGDITILREFAKRFPEAWKQLLSLGYYPRDFDIKNDDGIIQTLLGKMFPEESNTKEDKWRI